MIEKSDIDYSQITRKDIPRLTDLQLDDYKVFVVSSSPAIPNQTELIISISNEKKRRQLQTELTYRNNQVATQQKEIEVLKELTKKLVTKLDRIIGLVNTLINKPLISILIAGVVAIIIGTTITVLSQFIIDRLL